MIEVNTDPRWAPLQEDERREQQFNELVDEFNADAEIFAEDVGTIGGDGARFFWSTEGAQLHSHDVLSMKRVDYELLPAPSAYTTFEFGAGIVLTAGFSGDAWQISAYAADKPSTLIDTITWPLEKYGPGLGLLLQPQISIDENGVYLLNPEWVLHRWRPGMGAPEPLFSFADRGLVVGKRARFSVHGDNVLVFDDEAQGNVSGLGGGALWEVGLSGGAAQKVASSVADVCFHAGSAIFKVREKEESKVTFSLLRYSSSDGSTEDLTDFVREASVSVRGFPIDAERFETIIFDECQPGGFTFSNGLGLFLFDLQEREVQALHLKKIPDPREEVLTSIFYRSKIVEHVAFVSIQVCTSTGGPVAICEPYVVYRRDVSAP